MWVRALAGVMNQLYQVGWLSFITLNCGGLPDVPGCRMLLCQMVGVVLYNRCTSSLEVWMC